MDHRNIQMWQSFAGIDFLDPRVIPALDVTQEDFCQDGSRKKKATFYTGNVINGHDGDKDGRDLQNGVLRSVQLFVAHGYFASGEISNAPGNIFDTLHGSSAHIPDLHFGAELVIFFGPVGVERRRNIRAAAYQGGGVLAHCWTARANH